MSWGLGASPPPPFKSGKAIIFRANAKFFQQKPTAKNEKDIFFCIY